MHDLLQELRNVDRQISQLLSVLCRRVGEEAPLRVAARVGESVQVASDFLQTSHHVVRWLLRGTLALEVLEGGLEKRRSRILTHTSNRSG